MTHNERVLELLSDGEPHSHHEGYGLRVMLHSRVADLRRQGHEIACWREGGVYYYRLALREPEASGASGSRSAGTPVGPPHRGAEPPSGAALQDPSSHMGRLPVEGGAAPLTLFESEAA